MLSNVDNKHELSYYLSFYNQKTVVITDIDFCNPDVFNRFVDELNHYICDTNIRIVLFEETDDSFNKMFQSMSKRKRNYYSELMSMYDVNHHVYSRLTNFILPVLNPIIT